MNGWPCPVFAAGALAGGIIGNFLLQALFLLKLGVQFRPSLNLRHPGVVRVGKLALPVLIGVGMPQAFSLINSWFASYLAGGTISRPRQCQQTHAGPTGNFRSGDQHRRLSDNERTGRAR